jgi:hypothetical protein
VQVLALAVARSFIDHPSDTVFARDLFRTVLRQGVPAADAPVIAELAAEIKYRDVRVLRSASQEAPVLPPTPTDLYRVFAGQQLRAELTPGRGRLSLANAEGKLTLKIELSPLTSKMI